MAEGEAPSVVEAAHEGPDATAVAVVEPVRAGAVHGLRRRLGGDAVDRPVQVHDQQMVAVRPVAVGGGQSSETGVLDNIVRKLMALAERGEPSREAVRLHGVHRAHGSDHRLDVRDEPLDKAGGARNGEVGLVDEPRAGDGGVEGGIRQPHGAALAGQVRRRAARRACVRGGVLQHGEAQLGPVVGGQGRDDQIGQQDRPFSQAFDDRGFHEQTSCSPSTIPARGRL